jgi:hypothetical protein
MTRTPRLNARNGKDHWPHVSALLFGAGFTKGRRFGGSSEVLESQAMDLNSGELTESGDLCKYDNLNAGILEAMGVDPAPWFPDVPPFRGWIG